LARALVESRAAACVNVLPGCRSIYRWQGVIEAANEVPVMIKSSDPRVGTTTTQLTNITRSEPDPSLFQAPADYTVTKGRGPGMRGGQPGQPPVIN